MVPKVIHCCWFGGPKTKLAERCLASWRRFAPGWEIREWGLDDLPSGSRFLDHAIGLRRWAAASDWVRMWALKEHGGVYFDFDVELVGGIDDLCAFEWVASEWTPNGGQQLNPGGGIALTRGSSVAARMLELYEEQDYDPKAEMMSVITSNLADAMSRVHAPLRVLPPEWFSPIGSDGSMHRSSDTRAIHWYALGGSSRRRRIARWMSWHGMDWLVRCLTRRRAR